MIMCSGKCGLFDWQLTLNNRQKYDNHKKEECDVKQNTIILIRISIGWFNLIADSASGAHTSIQMEQETLENRTRHQC